LVSLAAGALAWTLVRGLSSASRTHTSGCHGSGASDAPSAVRDLATASRQACDAGPLPSSFSCLVPLRASDPHCLGARSSSAFRLSRSPPPPAGRRPYASPRVDAARP
jgi:hypothetical protein